MEQCPSCKANSRSASQESPQLLWNSPLVPSSKYEDLHNILQNASFFFLR
jgi:hypothetical protein